MVNTALPERFASVEALEEFMSTPSAALAADLARAPGDILVLGVGGKMGPTLARMAKRATLGRRVFGVARFSESGLRARLESWGVECVACDLLDRAALERLPRAPNVVFMAGQKFGAAGSASFTWAMNVAVPFMVAETFRESRIVVFSTACVYPYVGVESGGATEDTPAAPPPGEYANACVGRERAFEYGSRRWGTAGRLVRLEYAIDMRYGVLYDVASSVFSGSPLDLAMGHVNVIWQGDANEQALRLLAHCTAPASPINVSGPETLSVRWLAGEFGRRFGKAPVVTGSEAPAAWLVNTAAAQRLLGAPRVPLAKMIDWVADWVARGMPSLGKPTHFETRDGKF
ncbi:MAG: NAD-dependent epimerase/dehydratase family protein [Burkholderiales bacterium]|nr:NAD-dependent epimerase/dehydratase family protein [Burkholderiales bacterium]